MNKQFWICLCAATLVVVAEESATVNRNRVNVRGAPTINSEVVTRLQKGDKVTFLEEIPVEKPKPEEPARWAAIKLPPDSHVWVFTGFLNDKTVKVNRLNLRAGPGENYSVLGRLEKGAVVKEIRTVDQWMEVEPPDVARAYVDASFLDRGPVEAGKEIAEAPKPVLEQKPVVFEPPAKSTPAPTPTTTAQPTAPPPIIPQPQPQPTVVAETPKEEPKPAETVVKEEPAPQQPKPLGGVREEAGAPLIVVTAPTPTTPAPQRAAATETPPTRTLPPVGPIVATPDTIPPGQKRIVRREGEVRSTKFNIQAPTYFELVGEKGRILNYLSAEKAGIKLKDYKGLRVIVTGEEGIEPRYPERPLIEIETIEVAP